MEFKICKNSSGKVFGKIALEDNKIIVLHNTKPELIITEQKIINEAKKKTDLGIILLYDNCYLTIGEIAAIYEVPYSTLYKRSKLLQFNTGRNEQRRSSTYGRKLSEETKKKIGEASKGRIIPQYERTPEIREKISQGLKKYYSTHEVSEETRRKLSQAWADGKYKNSAMGRGIQGHFFSLKNNKKFIFRSLLELFYFLSLEEDITVQKYEVEPFSISFENHHYTPDILINDKIIVELKPSKHLQYTEENERFQKEIEVATKYAKNNKKEFRLIYDIDINFRTSTFKTYLKNNPQIIEKYQINFSREWSI